MLKPIMLLALALTLAACTPQQGKAAENTVIDSTIAECAVLNADLPEAELQTVCKFADTLLPIVRDLVGATHRKMAAAHCAPPPAGAP